VPLRFDDVGSEHTLFLPMCTRTTGRGAHTKVMHAVLCALLQELAADAHSPSVLMPRLMRHLSNFYAAIDLSSDGPCPHRQRDCANRNLSP
jgi:hypothetical protein